jgi:putative oxidoreductase
VAQSTERRRDLGLLVLRLGIGAMFVGHGLPKLLGGVKRWQTVGEAIGVLGIHFAPTCFGLAAALSEFCGGILLAAGLAFRPACALLLTTMVVATLHHVHRGDGFATASHAVEAAILFASLLLIGPGAWRLGR